MGRHPHLARFSAPADADREAVERAMELTDTLHLADARSTRCQVATCSGSRSPKRSRRSRALLLLDEPTSHLDLNHRLQVLDLVRDLLADGLGVLAVFHDLDLAARYSDRIAVVAGGGVSEARPPARRSTRDAARRLRRAGGGRHRPGHRLGLRHAGAARGRGRPRGTRRALSWAARAWRRR